MATLNFGVTPVPYPPFYNIGSRRPVKKASSYGRGMTTTDVANILEAKYHVMQNFATMHRADLLAALDVPGVMRKIVKDGAVPQLTVKGQARIKSMFKQFLANREMDRVVAGVPTEAAERGVSHRSLHPYAKGRASRPSFIDTRLYSNSFKVWITE